MEPRARGEARAGSIASTKGSAQNSPREEEPPIRRTAQIRRTEESGTVKELKDECGRLKEENSELKEKVERLRGEAAQRGER